MDLRKICFQAARATGHQTGVAVNARQKIRDEDQKLRLNTDPHSPGHYRVNGPLSDLPEFQKAFNVPDNAPMVRAADKRVNIW